MRVDRLLPKQLSRTYVKPRRYYNKADLMMRNRYFEEC